MKTFATFVEPRDPRERFAKPPFPQEKQTGSGSAAELNPPADYGESTYKGHDRLTGRAALITGADSGIGRAVALCFAKEGADIVFSFLEGDRYEQSDADETVRLIEAAGRRAIAIPGDIRQKSFCLDLVKRTIDGFGRLDILVNNAAFQRTYENLADPEEEFDRTYRTNVYGTFFLTQAALPEMKPGGVVLNSCSIEAFEPKDQLAPYASTKAALVSLTKSFSKLCIKHNNIHAQLQNELKKFKTIQISVENGVVDLEGTINDFATREEIDKRAHRTKNVTAVRNNLKIAGIGEISDAQLQQKIVQNCSMIA
jgi:NAD(P)-dependent dehydrogenase (short-subunit alcohol dehydrogenase family)